MKTKIFTLITAFCISTFTMAQIIHVPEDESSIQDGIDAADDGDTVLVAQDIYFENIYFDGKAITVASYYLIDPDSSHIYNTIIDGSEPAYPDNNSMVNFISGEDTTSVLCGFTIQNGTGTYPDTWGDRSGGGILCEYSGAKIIHNRIIDNNVFNNVSGAYGAGVCVSSETNYTLVLKDNFIANNEVNTSGYEYLASGGGVFVYCNHIIENNTIINNTAHGKWARGAGITTNSSTGIISDNDIQSNEAINTSAIGLGGGVFIRDPGSGIRITHNIIMYNKCTGGGTDYRGGGIGILNWGEYDDYHIDGNIIANNESNWGGGIFMSASESGCFITNNIIRDNQAYMLGGGIYSHNSDGKDQKQNLTSKRSRSQNLIRYANGALPQVINNTIVNNTAGTSGGGIFNGYEDNDLVAFNNIIYGNNAGQGAAVFVENIASNTYLYYNDIDLDMIHGPWSGTNNIFVDPQFLDEYFHLHNCQSQCINAGIETLNIVGSIFSCPDHDIDNENRPFEPTFPDIGADETPCLEVFVKKQQNDLLKVEKLTNSPNPFTETSVIKFELGSINSVNLSVYDHTGKKIQILLSQELVTGKHEIELDGSGLKNGIYFCVLKTNEGMQTRKIIKL